MEKIHTCHGIWRLATAGVALGPTTLATPQELFRNADSACPMSDAPNLYLRKTARD